MGPASQPGRLLCIWGILQLKEGVICKKLILYKPWRNGDGIYRKCLSIPDELLGWLRYVLEHTHQSQTCRLSKGGWVWFERLGSCELTGLRGGHWRKQLLPPRWNVSVHALCICSWMISLLIAYYLVMRCHSCLIFLRNVNFMYSDLCIF